MEIFCKCKIRCSYWWLTRSDINTKATCSRAKRLVIWRFKNVTTSRNNKVLDQWFRPKYSYHIIMFFSPKSKIGELHQKTRYNSCIRWKSFRFIHTDTWDQNTASAQTAVSYTFVMYVCQCLQTPFHNAFYNIVCSFAPNRKWWWSYWHAKNSFTHRYFRASNCGRLQIPIDCI